MGSQRFLQTPFWGSFKGAHGWTPYRFLLGADGALEPMGNDAPPASPEGQLSVLVRSFRIGIQRFSLAYVPMAPERSGKAVPEYARLLTAIAGNLRPYLPANTLFVRFDPPLDCTALEEREAMQEELCRAGTGLRKSRVDVQPPDTVLLSLDKEEDDLLAEMKSKWRYNIRLAEKKSVRVSRHHAGESGFDQAFETFYDLFRQTGERDGVSFHGKEYYRDLLERGAPKASPGSDPGDAEPTVTLYLARHDDDWLAGIITLFCGREAVYLYGASGNVKRNLMPAYLLQWTAIRDARLAGCPSYDFYGMPPTNDERHPMHGLYLFKTGFGGTIVHRPGSFDVPLRRAYALYACAEKVRAWWHRTVRKRLAGR